MKIELRKISYSAALSEETAAYSAQVWVDGVHVCDVSNHGTGGCDDQHPAKGKTYADVKALNAKIKTERPPKNTGMKLHGEDFIMEQDLETVCGDLLSDHLVAKDLKRALSSKVLFQKAGKPEIFQVSLKGIPASQHQQFFDIVKDRNQAERILNQMPFDEALAIYKAAA